MHAIGYLAMTFIFLGLVLWLLDQPWFGWLLLICAVLFGLLMWHLVSA